MTGTRPWTVMMRAAVAPFNVLAQGPVGVRKLVEKPVGVKKKAEKKRGAREARSPLKIPRPPAQTEWITTEMGMWIVMISSAATQRAA